MITALSAKLSRHEFDSLDDAELGPLCFEPMIIVYKTNMRDQPLEKEHEFKSQFYKQLTDGQRALFMFYAYYNHARKSPAEFIEFI